MIVVVSPGDSEDLTEFMTEPTDRAVVLLQRVSELLLESRAIVKELEAVPDGESSADAADRIAYGILVAALEEGLVNTIRHALGNSLTHDARRLPSERGGNHCYRVLRRLRRGEGA